MSEPSATYMVRRVPQIEYHLEYFSTWHKTIEEIEAALAKDPNVIGFAKVGEQQ